MSNPCPHCPDGHTPPWRGSQPWGAFLGGHHDEDGQPTTIIVQRSGAAHVAESDAEWIYQVLNTAGPKGAPAARPAFTEDTDG